MVTNLDVTAIRRPSSCWVQLAAVARERASEQFAKAMIATSTVAASPHLEQQAYLMKLAEVYEKRARAGPLA